MNWRCEWCGKPHEENDPPCDNCGHGSFEKAVVPRTDLAEGEREPALVWVCTECSREHPKNAPPCSRCGNTTLEKRRQEIDESELEAPSYRELLTPGYVAAVLVLGLAMVVFALGVAGVIALPGFGGDGPTVEGTVPGNATSADGIDISEIETAYLDALADREDVGAGAERSAALDELATYANQQQLAWSARSESPTVEQYQSFLADLEQRFGEECNGEGTRLTVTVDYEPTDTPEAIAERLVERALADESAWNPGATATIGLDGHAVDGELVLQQLSCSR